MKREVVVPDIGDFHDVEVVEILVAPGARVAKDASLISIESDKATLEVPSPWAGTVAEIHVKLGDRVSQGSRVASLEVEEAAEAPGAAPSGPPAAAAAAAPAPAPERAPAPQPRSPAEPARTGTAPPREAADGAPVVAVVRGDVAHASPSVRLLARELGVDLSRVQGSGRKGRILRTDVQAFVKSALSGAARGPAGGEALPPVDFAKFGPIEVQELPNIRRITGRRLHAAWSSIPHVTQHDEADVTELEAYRKAQSAAAEGAGVKLTLLPFAVKAVVAALREYPRFCASLDPAGEKLVLKKYFHVGVAVDTPNGLIVPVLRDADRKGVLELARELADLSARARERKLRPEELAGGCFSISSLGGIGGSFFTPIINPPEVAILGISRHALRPVYRDGELLPRLLLPLSLSYDHRVIDGAEGARFMGRLVRDLSDVRNLLL
jgi:pyruvate dehydrogenase E2 component (dihydrolipoamide acetyltransferase)